MLQLAYPAAAVTTPSGASPEPASHVTCGVLPEPVQPAAQPKPTQEPAGSATTQPRAAHASASFAAQALPGVVGGWVDGLGVRRVRVWGGGEGR